MIILICRDHRLNKYCLGICSYILRPLSHHCHCCIWLHIPPVSQSCYHFHRNRRRRTAHTAQSSCCRNNEGSRLGRDRSRVEGSKGQPHVHTLLVPHMSYPSLHSHRDRNNLYVTNNNNYKLIFACQPSIYQNNELANLLYLL